MSGGDVMFSPMKSAAAGVVLFFALTTLAHGAPATKPSTAPTSAPAAAAEKPAAPVDPNAPPTLEAVYDRLMEEADHLMPRKDEKVRPQFTRPHPMVAKLSQHQVPAIRARMLKAFTGNVMKDEYIRYHLLWMLMQPGPEMDPKVNSKATVGAVQSCSGGSEAREQAGISRRAAGDRLRAIAGW
jgi:hypothetical protein